MDDPITHHETRDTKFSLLGPVGMLESKGCESLEAERVREPRCKVCALPDDLVDEVEHLRLVEHRSNPTISLWLAEEMRKRYSGVAPESIPTARNLSSHFRHAARPVESRLAYFASTVNDRGQVALGRSTPELYEILRDRRLHELVDPLTDQLEELTEQREVLASEILRADRRERARLHAQYLATAREIRDTIRSLQRLVDPREIFRVIARDLYGQAIQDVLAAVWQGVSEMARESGRFTRSRNLDAEFLELLDHHLQALVPRVSEVASDHADRMLTLFDRVPGSA